MDAVMTGLLYAMLIVTGLMLLAVLASAANRLFRLLYRKLHHPASSRAHEHTVGRSHRPSAGRAT